MRVCLHVYMYARGLFRREEFFEMMQALAEKRFASGDGVSQREMDDLFDFGDSDDDAEGKSAGGGAASKK